MSPAKARSLFDTALSYEGPAVLGFGGGDEIAGTARLEIDEGLKTTALLRVTEVRCSRPLGFPLSILQPAVPGTARPIPDPEAPSFASSFRMDVAAGEVRSASAKVHFSASVHFGGQPEATLRLDPGLTEFLGEQIGPAKYFVVPLVNYVADWPEYNVELDTHPMRVIRAVDVPEQFAREHPDLVALERQRRNGTVEFEFEGRRVFLQPIDDYEDRRERVESGADRARITALLVGDIADRPITWPSVQAWFPWDLMGLLSLATGSDVEFPWIEFRSENGALLRRLHFHSNPPVFTRRGQIISESIHRGTGRLLSQGLRSPHFAKPHLRAAVHTICSRPDRVINLDHRLRELIIALEALANGPGVVPDGAKRRRLSARWRKPVQKVLSEAKEAIAAFESEAKAAIERLAEGAATAGETDDEALLRKLAQAVQCRLSNDVSFAEVIRAMLDVLALPDALILDPWFRSHPYWKRPWSSVIANLRARLVHRGIADVGAEGRSTAEMLEITQHLEDLLVRVVFRLLQYDGDYQPTVAKWPVQAPVGWVTRDTTPAQLGFTSVGEPGQGEAQEGGVQSTGPEEMGT